MIAVALTAAAFGCFALGLIVGALIASIGSAEEAGYIAAVEAEAKHYRELWEELHDGIGHSLGVGE